jgi:hypothetical protein
VNVLSRQIALQDRGELERLSRLAKTVCNEIEFHERLVDTSELEHAFQAFNRHSQQTARTASLIRHLQNSCDNRCFPDLTGPLENWGDYPSKALETIIQDIIKHGYDYHRSGELSKARLIKTFVGRLSKTEAYYHLSSLLMIEAKDWKEVSTLLETATKLYPCSFLLALQHIKILRRRYEWDAIIRFSAEFRLTHGTHYGLALQEGMALLATGRHDEAISLLEPFIEKHASVPADQLLHIRTIYGLCLRRAKRTQDAKRQFQLAFRSGLESAGIHLANLQLEMKRPDVALALYKRLENGSFSLYAHMGMYRSFQCLEQEQNALDMLKATLDGQPSILKALVIHSCIDPLPVEGIEAFCMKIGSATTILDELGDSVFFENNVFWRLWPPSREQR